MMIQPRGTAARTQARQWKAGDGVVGAGSPAFRVPQSEPRLPRPMELLMLDQVDAARPEVQRGRAESGARRGVSVLTENLGLPIPTGALLVSWSGARMWAIPRRSLAAPE